MTLGGAKICLGGKTRDFTQVCIVCLIFAGATKAVWANFGPTLCSKTKNSVTETGALMGFNGRVAEVTRA